MKKKYRIIAGEGETGSVVGETDNPRGARMIRTREGHVEDGRWARIEVLQPNGQYDRIPIEYVY